MHPQICNKFQRYGDNFNGCKKGKGCEKFHPQICKFSSDGKHCGDTKCKRLHLRKQAGREVCKFSVDGQHCGDKKCRRVHEKSPTNEETHVPTQRNHKAHYDHTDSRMPAYYGRFDEPVFEMGETQPRDGHHSNKSNSFLEVKEEVRLLREQVAKMQTMLERKDPIITERPCMSSTHPNGQSRWVWSARDQYQGF